MFNSFGAFIELNWVRGGVHGREVRGIQSINGNGDGDYDGTKGVVSLNDPTINLSNLPYGMEGITTTGSEYYLPTSENNRRDW